LILDIDHTLIHGFPKKDIKTKENEEKLQTHLKSGRAFLIKLDLPLLGLYGYEMYILKRTGLHEFLDHMIEFCTIYVYTHGNYTYAKQILNQIDPYGKYFSDDWLRALSEEESKNWGTTAIKLKTLTAFFDNEIDKANSIIIDDSYKAWVEEDRKRIILSKKFMPFYKYDS